MRKLVICVMLIVCSLTAYAERERGGLVTESFAIHYRVNSTAIDEDFMDNRNQIHKIKYYLEHSPRIDSITIYAWASPEGDYKRNEILSRQRARAAKKFLLNCSTDSLKLNSGKIMTRPVAENWQGLEMLVKEKYTLADRDKVLKIIRDGRLNAQEKKKRLQKLNGGRSWKYLVDNYMPELRAATWVCVWGDVVEPIEPVNGPVALLQMPYESFRLAPMAISKPQKDTVVSPRTLFALKTNLLYDAVTALNFEVEVPFGERWSVAVEDVFPWWTWGPNDNKYAFQMLELGIEPRYWFLRKDGYDVLEGHFVGAYAMSSKYDFQWDKALCYQGEYWSAGLTYGYSLPVKNWLNLEFSASVGYVNSDYRHYQPSPGYELLYIDRFNTGVLKYFGLTKLKFSMVVPIRVKTKTIR